MSAFENIKDALQKTEQFFEPYVDVNKGTVQEKFGFVMDVGQAGMEVVKLGMDIRESNYVGAAEEAGKLFQTLEKMPDDYAKFKDTIKEMDQDFNKVKGDVENLLHTVSEQVQEVEADFKKGGIEEVIDGFRDIVKDVKEDLGAGKNDLRDIDQKLNDFGVNVKGIDAKNLEVAALASGLSGVSGVESTDQQPATGPDAPGQQQDQGQDMGGPG
jgi:methyl-accepting chemotaxis protein